MLGKERTKSSGVRCESILVILFESPAKDTSARARAKGLSQSFMLGKRASELLQMIVIMSRTFGWCFSSHKQCRVLHCGGPASKTLLKCKLVFKTDTDSNESVHLNSALTPCERGCRMDLCFLPRSVRPRPPSEFRLPPGVHVFYFIIFF